LAEREGAGSGGETGAASGCRRFRQAFASLRLAYIDGNLMRNMKQTKRGHFLLSANGDILKEF
jgi:hypothetical protein